MIDVYCFYGLLILWCGWISFSRVRKGIPQFGSDLRWEALLDANQRTYERFARRRAVGRLMIAVAFVYSIVRPLAFPSQGTVPAERIRDAIIVAVVSFLISAAFATVVRFRFESRIAGTRTDLQACVAPLGYRFLPLAVIGSLLLGIVLSLVDDGPRSSIYIIVGVLGELLFLRLLLIRRRQNITAVPQDSSLARLIGTTVAKFNKPPRGVLMLRSMLANGYAAPDGTVFITNGLRTIATEEEVSALIAHEMSHVRDGDAKRLRIVLVCIVLAVAGFVSAVLSFVEAQAGGGIYVVPSGILAAVFGLTYGRVILGRFSIPREFKCDADAAALGLAEEMASVLIKIHAYSGLPRRFVGLDRYLLTHPSLDDRLAALGAK